MWLNLKRSVALKLRTMLIVDETGKAGGRVDGDCEEECAAGLRSSERLELGSTACNEMNQPFGLEPNHGD